MLKTLTFISRSTPIIAGTRRAFSTNVTKDTFESLVLKSSKPTVVDFYADWCPPCRALEGPLKKTCEENGNVNLVKVNIDQEPSLAERYNVMSIPHVVGFKDGLPVFQFTGAIPPAHIKKYLEQFDK